MPFTLCHPALVLPLYRYRKSMTSLPGLVIGSMAPDFVYFFSLGISGAFTHTPAGLLLYCLPAGFVVYLLYQFLIREPMMAWLPGEISTRMYGPTHWPLRGARSAAVVFGSLGIGAASHIAWDGFTHADTFMTGSLAVFQMPVSLGGFAMPFFKVLQHLSSVVGFIAIVAVVMGWFARTVPVMRSGTTLTRWKRLVVFVTVIVAALASAGAARLLRPARSVEHGLFNVVVSSMAAGAVAIFCLCCLWHVRVWRGALRT